MKFFHAGYSCVLLYGHFSVSVTAYVFYGRKREQKSRIDEAGTDVV